jgi:hypothetical protein
MRSKPSPTPDPAPPDPVAEVVAEPAVTAEPVPVGILTALRDFTLPSEAQRHGSSMGGRNPRHDLIQAAGHISAAVQQLKSVALDATASHSWAAVEFLNAVIERLS